MSKESLIAIFDVGKTNKKLFLFDDHYQIAYEQSQTFEEIKDEDGFPTENIDALSRWICEKFREVSSHKNHKISAVNFSAYGASMIHLGNNGKPITPLYNYLKPFPEKLKNKFYDAYGGETLLAKQTASPVLGSLNSGLQLYRLKYEQPKVYEQIKYTLHLPQYLSFLICSTTASEITSIGCHTHLWDFEKHHYHEWVYKEEIDKKFSSIYPSDKVVGNTKDNLKIPVGIGLHDSSAALIPYLAAFSETFVLISTGTWCISLNPFNQTPITEDELQNDCLCYLTYHGKPVKASRLFAGYEHEQQVKRLGEHFDTANDFYKTVKYNSRFLKNLETEFSSKNTGNQTAMIQQSAFSKRDLNDFENYEEAYHQLINDLIHQQVESTKIVLHDAPVKKIFVDGGFSKNEIYMNLLANAFPEMEVYAASIPQASALGAALAIHSYWNKNQLPGNLINLKFFHSSNHQLK